LDGQEINQWFSCIKWPNIPSEFKDYVKKEEAKEREKH